MGNEPNAEEDYFVPGFGTTDYGTFIRHNAAPSQYAFAHRVLHPRENLASQTVAPEGLRQLLDAVQTQDLQGQLMDQPGLTRALRQLQGQIASALGREAGFQVSPSPRASHDGVEIWEVTLPPLPAYAQSSLASAREVLQQVGAMVLNTHAHDGRQWLISAAQAEQAAVLLQGRLATESAPCM